MAHQILNTIGAVSATTITSTVSGGANIALEKAVGANISFYQSGISTSAIEDITGQGGLRFYTGTAGILNERARIDSSGNLLVGTTSQFDSGQICADGGNSVAIPLTCKVTQTVNATQINFRNGNGTVGNINTNGTATTYNTSSDYRLKDSPRPLTGSGAFIDALKPKTWSWKADGAKGVGFIAHEFAEVSPSSVSGEKDATEVQTYEVSPAVSATFDADGKELTPAIVAVMGERTVPKYQGMQASSAEVIANLVAEIQDLRKRLAAAGIA